MKIIHFSDTHLGFNDLDIVDNYGINQREADFYKSFEDIIDAIVDIKPNYVIHTGDLFHRASPSNRAITFVLNQLKRLEKISIPFVIIAGNHSTPRTSTSSPILAALNSLDNVIAVYKQKYEKVEFEDIVFHALPHINDERIIDNELAKIEKNIDLTKKNIMLMHCSVGANYLMHEFGEWVYPENREYIFDKMDYVALGHWHGFGNVKKYKNVYYAGSTERTSSNDKREDKGYVIIDLKEGLSIKHNVINLRKSISYTIDARDYNNQLEELDLSNIRGALVEIRLINLSVTTSIDITNKELNELFKDALYIRVKREFEELENNSIDSSVEAISLEDYFVSYIKDKLEDKKEQERLVSRAKELFACYEEAEDDTL